MEELNSLNIPAYQRKRSILAKARRSPFYKNDAPKIVKAKKPLRTARKVRPPKNEPATYIQDENLSYIPVRNSPTIEDLFPEESQSLSSRRKSEEVREMKTCGLCEGYFDKIDVAIIRVTSPIRVGDTLIFEKQDGLFEQVIDSMQIDRKNVTIAKTGSEIGLKVRIKPIVGANVYKVLE